MKHFIRVLLCAIVFLICQSTAYATDITIQSVTLPNWNDARTNTELWVFANESFISSDGTPVLAGNTSNRIVAKRVACTVNTVSRTITIPQFTIISTTDGQDIETATYTAYFMTPQGAVIRLYDSFESFRVPSLLSSASGCTPNNRCGTWSDIRSYNFTRIVVRRNEAYTKDEVNALLAAIESNSGGGAGEPVITRTPSTFFTNEFSLSALSNGLLKNNTGTGIPSIAVPAIDYELPITVTGPLARVGQNLSIPQANGSTDGFLDNLDWTTFNNKENILSFNSPLSRVGNAVSLNPISDALIASGANIALNKLAALTAGRALISDGSGIVSPSSVTSATLAFLDATSSVQTQLNGKQALDADLTALAALNSTGLIARIGASSYALRTNVAASNRLSINFADGSTGDPTFDVVEANLSLNNIGGILGPPKGGTGLNALGTANQIPGINSGATAYEFKSIVGTSNEVSVTHTPNTITLGIPATVDFSNKAATLPVKAGTSAPGSCVASKELFIDTDATPGQQLFICNAAGNGFVLVGDAGGAGTGITSINGETGASQTLSDVDDTNVTLLITSTGDNHEFQLGWSGQLAKSRQHANTVYSDQANTYSAGSKQTFQPSATFAGLNIASGSDPSSLSQGDVWINGDAFMWRGSAASFSATPDGRNLTAGNGLTGGGTLASDRTFDVVGGVGITANSNDVAWSPDTFVANVSLWNASQATRDLTANLSGATDPIIRFGNDLVNIIAALQINGVAVPTISSTNILTNKDLGSGNSVSQSLSWGDGIKQTFNPNGTTAGFNVGSHTADPSSPSNADAYYNSTTNKWRFRENGAWVELGGGGSPGGGNLSLQYNSSGVFAGSTGHTFNSNVLRFGVQAVGSPASGDYWYDATQTVMTSRQAGLTVFQSGTFFVATAGATVANTTTETSIVGSGIGTTTIPANFFVPGRTIRVTVRGVLGTTGSIRSFTVRLKLGSTSVVTLQAQTESGATSGTWWAQGEITCRTTGGSGTVIGGGVLGITNLAATNFLGGFAPTSTSTVTINTTASQVLGVTAQWTAATASDTATTTQIIFETLN